MKLSPTVGNIHMQESKPVPNTLKIKHNGKQVDLTSYAQIKNMQMSLILLCCRNSKAITILETWLPTGCNLYEICNKDFLGFVCHKEGLVQLCSCLIYTHFCKYKPRKVTAICILTPFSWMQVQSLHR